MKNLSLLFILSIGLFFSNCALVTEPEIQLTIEEEEDLLFLWQEEQLARDVYNYAYNKYAVNIFFNISRSEQTHMNKVAAILSDYGLTAPEQTEPGVFENPEIQQLYEDFTERVDISIVEALKVGATIEDLDIRDLMLNESRTEKEDILAMYALLRCGSGNHIRAFTSRLNNEGVVYVPQYLSQEEYDEIIAQSHESCGH